MTNQELERFEPAEASGRIAYEHLHRYALCRQRVAGVRVLDVACGAGYGTNILAAVASEVVGVDIDPGAIRRASKKYRRDNLQFVVADCTSMPFDSGSFDAVVANEMIEHIHDQEGFLSEAKRVLKPGGMLLVSTPNKPIYNRYKSPNPFHVAEMTIAEFRRLLSRHFAHVRMTGLRMALVSASFRMDESASTAGGVIQSYRGSRLQKGRPEVQEDELQLDEPEYMLAICSNEPLADAGEQPSIFFSNDDDLWLEHEKIMSWASQLHEEDEVLRTNLRRTSAELEAATATLEEERREHAQARDQAWRHLDMAATLLARMTGSEVEAKPVALVDAMFAVNEQIASQRERLERLAKAELRLQQLEREIDSRRAAQELQVKEMQREHRGARLKLEQSLEQLRTAHESVQRDLRQSELRLEQLQRFSRERNAERDKAARDAEQRLADLQQELDRTKRALDQLRSSVPEELRNAASASGNGARSRRLSRLISAHRDILRELGEACAAMRGAVPPSPARKRSLLSRVAGRQALASSLPFDREWVKRQLPATPAITLRQIVSRQDLRAVDPHPLFSAAYYLERNPDVGATGVSPYLHYVEHGWREGRDPHPYFKNDWYLHHNADVLRAGANPLVHYLEHGWKEGRRPNPVFDPTDYLRRYSDVQSSGLEPLTHFIMYGAAEDREVPFQGLERDWRTLIDADRFKTLMDYLLAEVADPAAPAVERQAVLSGSWPPAPVNGVSVPQAVRDLMVQRGWESLLPHYAYFYSVIDAYSENGGEFVNSPDCDALMERARGLAGQRKSNSASAPQASVIIPVYNNVLDTMLCIVSLLETAPAVPFEIIIADDCSTDATAELIPQIGGIVRHVRHAENHGFLGNCNLAAEQASGETVVLLNNDTLVLPGWMENLLAPFSRFERVGLVGSKLIAWDGRLQEAGGIFWNDGSAWNFGRGQDANDSEFNYLKDVDYCSGASIAIPAALWRELGGFDRDYAPAYCEDSDLAFRLRAAGYRTLYSPHSELIHHEGRSHGTDLDTGVKAHQRVNEQRLLEKWRGELKRDHFPNGENVLRARDRSAGKRHMLVIDHYVPQFDRDAGSRTMFQFIEALIEQGWMVTFWPENLNHDVDYTRALQNMGAEVIYGPKFAGKFADFLRDRVGLYDAVLLSRPHVAVNFIDDVKALTDARVLYYGHDVHFQRMKAQNSVAGSIEEEAVEAMRALELGVCDRCDVVLYPSKDEAQFIAPLVDPRVQARDIPAYCFPDAQLQSGAQKAAQIRNSSKQRPELLFVGGFAHGPNTDGIAWFCRDVVPVLRDRGFEFNLQIVGSNPTAEVWDLENEHTQVLGFVSDERLRELYASASIVIAPLRFGAGVKGKVVEAVAQGVPVVTTGVGAQGLDGAPDFLFLGDTAEEFASAVIAASDGPSAGLKAEQALQFVREHYSKAAMMAVFEELLPAPAAVSRAA